VFFIELLKGLCAKDEKSIEVFLLKPIFFGIQGDEGLNSRIGLFWFGLINVNIGNITTYREK
jgi:hypothetical protein